MTEIKTGLKSTEFWVTGAAVLIPFVSSAFSLNFPTDAFIAIIAYILTRGWLKAKAI